MVPSKNLWSITRSKYCHQHSPSIVTRRKTFVPLFFLTRKYQRKVSPFPLLFVFFLECFDDKIRKHFRNTLMTLSWWWWWQSQERARADKEEVWYLQDNILDTDGARLTSSKHSNVVAWYNRMIGHEAVDIHTPNPDDAIEWITLVDSKLTWNDNWNKTMH